MQKSLLESLWKKKLSRKNFMKLCIAGMGGFFAGNALRLVESSASDGKVFYGRRPKNIPIDHDLIMVKGDDPYAMTMKAVEAMGGMDKFVNKGDVVLIKPNMGWDRIPEQAGNTNPDVIAALVELSFRSGAKRVNIFDRTCNDARRCYDNSGIAEAARQKGANVYFVDDWNFVEARFPYKSPMEGWPVYRDALECDTFINVPILKHHGLTGLTLSMKNLMGVCGGERGLIHTDIGVRLAHLTDFIKPDLTVIDAYRVLTRHGPSGGDLKDVEDFKTIIAGTDPVLVDSYACELMGKDPLSITYIREAVDNNLGKFETGKADILRIEV